VPSARKTEIDRQPTAEFEPFFGSPIEWLTVLIASNHYGWLTRPRADVKRDMAKGVIKIQVPSSVGPTRAIRRAMLSAPPHRSWPDFTISEALFSTLIH
jgi:hypothetical protein